MACMKNLHHLLASSEIQPLMVVVMVGPLLALTTKSSSPGPHLKEASFDLLPLNDVLFTEDVLLEVSARSRIECSKKCVETEGCVMCTFLSSPQGPPGHCRLHSQLQNPNDTKTSMPGARSMARRRPCDGGFELACGRCLKAVNTALNYTEARRGCNGKQGHLAMPKSAGEIGCVQSFVRDNSWGWMWVGADDFTEPNVFRWNDGTLLSGNSPLWNVGEPGADSAGRKGVFVYMDGCLRDGGGHRARPHICQKDGM